MATNAEEFVLKLKSNLAPVATKDERALAALDAQVRAAQRAVAGLDTKNAAASAALAAQQSKFIAAAAALRKAREGAGGSPDAAQERAARAKFLTEGKSFRAAQQRAKAASDAAMAGRKELAILKGVRPELARQAVEAKRAAASKERWKERTQQLGAAVHAVGGPMSTWLDRMQKIAPIAELSGAAILSLGAIALSVVLVGGLLAAYGALVTFGLGAAAAARSARILGDALAGVSQRPGQEFVAVVNQLARQVPLARGQLQEMAKEMALLRLGGRDLQAGLTAVATVTSALGDSAGRGVRGIVEQSAALRRFTLGARDLWGQYQMLAGTGLTKADVIGALAKQLGRSAGDVEKMLLRGQVKLKDGLRALEAASKGRFGKTIAAQMLDFDTQVAKAKEAFAGMFSGLNLEPALAAFQAFLKIFDESTVSGKVMKAIMTAGFQKIIDLIALALPLARKFFYGMATAALELYIAMAPTIFGIAKMVKGLVGAKGAIDGFSAGKAVMYTLAAAVGIVGVALFAALSPLLLLGAALYGVYKAGQVVYGALQFLWPVISTIGKLILIVLAPALALSAVLALAAAGVLYGLARAALFVGTVVYRVGAAIVGALGAALSFIANLDVTKDAIALASRIIDGLVEGIVKGAGRFVGAIKDLALAGIRAFTSTNEIRSPSHLYERKALQIPPGAARGVDRGASLLAQSVADMSAAAAPQLGAGVPDIGVSATGGNGSVVVNFNAPVSIGAGESKESFAEFLVSRITAARMGGAAEVGA